MSIDQLIKGIEAAVKKLRKEEGFTYREAYDLAIRREFAEYLEGLFGDLHDSSKQRINGRWINIENLDFVRSRYGCTR